MRWGEGSNWADWVCDSTVSDRDGRFVLAGLGGRPHEIRAEKPGYASYSSFPGKPLSMRSGTSLADLPALELRLDLVR